MNARAEFKTRRAEASRAALRLALAFHPHWSSRDDHALMTARAKRENFTVIAKRLGRSRIAVEQRWHRLRVIPNVVKLLEAYGLSSKPYSLDGGADG